MDKIIETKQWENGNVDSFFNLPYEKQLRTYFTNGDFCGKELVRYENLERYASLEHIEYKLKFSGKSFFLKQKNTAKFLYDKVKRRIIYNNYRRDILLRDLCYLPRFDWLEQEYQKNNINSTVMSNAVVRDILLGKLTNCEDIVKQYIKSLHVKNISWKTYVNYLNIIWYPSLSLQWLEKATTDTNVAMEYITNSDSDRVRLFRDMINQALALNKKINPKWSEKRMGEEHTKMTRELMQLEIEEKEQTPIHENCPEFKYPCKILNSEQDVFFEGKCMHHCIYTNYWNRINQKRYLGISFTEPERFTLGLRASEDGYVFDQAYLKYDKKISQESKDMIDTFLNDPDVQEQLNKLELNYKSGEEKAHEITHVARREPEREPEQNIDETDEDWVNSILRA